MHGLGMVHTAPGGFLAAETRHQGDVEGSGSFAVLTASDGIHAGLVCRTASPRAFGDIRHALVAARSAWSLKRLSEIEASRTAASSFRASSYALSFSKGRYSSFVIVRPPPRERQREDAR
jgi:hypothetical protein